MSTQKHTKKYNKLLYSKQVKKHKKHPFTNIFDYNIDLRDIFNHILLIMYKI